MFMRNKLLRNIHKYGKGNGYYIQKEIKGKKYIYSGFKTLNEAISYRDKLKANNWQPFEDIETERKIKQYFKNIHLDHRKTHYIVTKNQKYSASFKNIEDALHYRDIITNNTYVFMKNKYYAGLEYPIPDKLKVIVKPKRKARGYIVKNSKQSYKVLYKKKYICSTVTYEHAYYIREELNKVDWDLTQLDNILEHYPVWYTKLIHLYRYIVRSHNDKDKYQLMIPLNYRAEKNKLESVGTYYKIEDALYERDILVENGWDYDLLVETIDDSKNPYYDMDLPPFPERQITNTAERDYHEKELTEMYHLILEYEDITQKQIADKFGIADVTLRNWLKRFWNTTYTEFKRIALNGENPLEVLEKVPIIYQPDLSIPKPPNFNGYVQKNSNSTRSPYNIVRKGVWYGSYHTKKQARQAVKLLKNYNWDKSKLSEIQKKVGYTQLTKRNNIYPNSNGRTWSIRRKDKNRKIINYGSYTDYELAVIVRDMLVIADWDKKEYYEIRKTAEHVLTCRRQLFNNMFSGDYANKI